MHSITAVIVQHSQTIMLTNFAHKYYFIDGELSKELYTHFQMWECNILLVCKYVMIRVALVLLPNSQSNLSTTFSNYWV